MRTAREDRVPNHVGFGRSRRLPTELSCLSVCPICCQPALPSPHKLLTCPGKTQQSLLLQTIS